MKKIITLLLLILLQKIVVSQNVGIGTTDPFNKLHIVGTHQHQPPVLHLPQHKPKQCLGLVH